MQDRNMSAVADDSTPNQTEIDRLKQLYYPYIVPPILFLCLLGVLANGIILLSVRWLHRTPSPLLMFTISLCVADFWLAIQQSVNFILEGYLPHVLGIKVNQAPCQALMMEAVRCGALITSMLHLFALASNHYIGIVRPLHYKNTMTPELTYAIICIIWFLPTVTLVIFFVLKSNDGFIPSGCMEGAFYSNFSFRLAIGLIFIIPLILMFFIYAHIGVLLIRRRRNPHLSAHMPANLLRRNLKAATTTTLYLGTFTVCWMPSIIMFILLCHRGCPIDFPSFARENPVTLLVMGSVIQVSIVMKAMCDAAIYAARVREIQFAMRSMLSRLSCGPWTVCKSFDTSEYRSSICHGGASSIAPKCSVIDRDRPRSFASSMSPSICSRQTSIRTHRCRYESLPDADQLHQRGNGETDNCVIECRSSMRSRRSLDQPPNEYRKVSIRIPSIVNEEMLRELNNETSSTSLEDRHPDHLDHVVVSESPRTITPSDYAVVSDSPRTITPSDFTVVSGFTLPVIEKAVKV